MTIKRVRGGAARAELIEMLRQREPESTMALASLVGPASKERSKVWVLRREGKIVGTLVSARWCFDRWAGTMLLDDLSCAQEMAAALDRSNLWTVSGPVDALEAVLPHARRSRGWLRLWFYSIPQQPPEAADSFDRNTDVTIRAATPNDLDALVEVYSYDEHSGGVSRRRLRQAIRQRIPYTRVAELDGRVVGALVVPETGAYRIFDLLAVHPDARGNRLGMAMLIDAGTDAVIAGLGVCGLRAMTNGMRVSHEEALMLGDSVVWVSADLRPPRRFRGQTRLRRLLDRLEGGVIRPPRAEPSPYSVLPEQAHRAGATEAADRPD